MLGLELQNHIHYAMPVRTMLYDAIEYDSQVQRTARANRQHPVTSADDSSLSDHTSDTFLSGFRKEDKLIPVITLVLYLKPDRWDGPRSLSEMYAPYDKAIEPYINDYSMNLLSPAELESDDFKLFSTEIGKVLEFIKCSRDKKDMETFMKENTNLNLSGKSVVFLNEVTHSKLTVDDKGGDVVMCKALDDMCADAMEEGLKKGLKKGLSEGESRMSRLISVLLSQNNLEAAKLATSDSDARNRLYKQYNII